MVGVRLQQPMFLQKILFMTYNAPKGLKRPMYFITNKLLFVTYSRLPKVNASKIDEFLDFDHK